MKRLSTQTFHNDSVPKSLKISIGHPNVHSYLVKDEAMKQANIMCFTETFLRPHQHIDHDYVPMQESVLFSDWTVCSRQALANSGVMIICVESTSNIHLSWKWWASWQLLLAECSCLQTPSATTNNYIIYLSSANLPPDIAHHCSWRLQ